jgi:hypothetical protein
MQSENNTAAPDVSSAAEQDGTKASTSEPTIEAKASVPEISAVDAIKKPDLSATQDLTDRHAQAAVSSKRGRFPLLAASVAIAAAVGSAAGAGAFGMAAHFLTPAPIPQQIEPSDDARELRERVGQLRASVKSLSDTVAALRTAVDSSGKGQGAQLVKLNEQVAKLQEAVERSERQHAEPNARLSKAIEALERGDRRGQAPETTGSIPTPTPRPELPKPAIVEGWVLRQVIDGVAILEGRDRVIEVEPGDVIRGVGRVEDIRRKDGRWVVVTAKGNIVAAR